MTHRTALAWATQFCLAAGAATAVLAFPSVAAAQCADLPHTFVVALSPVSQGDFDGDGRTDPAIYRPSTGLWAILKSSTNYTTSATVSWGLSTDVAVPGDYDGDGKTDPVVFRPSTGGWYILLSSTNYSSSFGVSWGLSTDIPAPADYDGDGRFDPAIFRPSTGLWAVLKSSTNYTTSFTVSWGLSTDTPMNRRP
jgi:hypothetical protein